MFGKMIIRSFFAVALVCISSNVACQVTTQPQPKVAGAEPLTEVTLITLHEAGLQEGELRKLIDRNGMTALNHDAIVRMRAKGFPEGILQPIETKLAPRPGSPLTVQDIIALVKSKVPAERVVRHIQASGTRFDLTTDDYLTLVRAQVPPEVIQHMRSTNAIVAEIEQRTTTVALQDVVDMSKSGLATDEILRRIRKVGAKFDVTVEDLLQMRREGVAPEVLKEVWSLRPGKPIKAEIRDATAKADTPQPPEASATSRPAKSKVTITHDATREIHREPTGGWSMTVPTGWYIYRETRNANSLVSFSREQIGGDRSVPSAEIQILRYRSRQPERLVEQNLDAIGTRFLNMLKANYVKKGLSLYYKQGRSIFLSGRPARAYKVASNTSTGTSQEGEMIVTWFKDQVFVLSFSCQAERFEAESADLEAALRSFTLERPRKIMTEDAPTEPIEAHFEAWRVAVQQRDYALYRQLKPPGSDNVPARMEFVALSNRISDRRVRVVLGTVESTPDRASLQARVLGAQAEESIPLTFVKSGSGWQLAKN